MTQSRAILEISRFACRAVLGVLCVLFVPGLALAACPAANQYSFSFANQSPATLNYANTYNYSATSTALAAQNFSVSFTTNGLSSTTVGGFTMPAISNFMTDGVAANNLVVGGIFGARSNAAFTTNYVETSFTFPVAIRDFSVQINDVDFTNNQFRDWVQVTGVDGAASYTPSITTPWGTNNGVGGARTNASSSMVLGTATTPVSVTVNQTVGAGTSGNNSTTGTMNASFIQPVRTVRIRWGNYPLQAGETTTGQQAIGIQQISFCPMPQLTVAKTSAAFATASTDPNRFSIPGSDILYTFTVTNSNSSPLDLNSAILTDILPSNLTFYNGDIDGAGPLTTNFEFIPGTSGLTLAPANISYSNNGGASYTYAPIAGYDPAMTALRLNPQGAMPANSSFSIKIRARVK